MRIISRAEWGARHPNGFGSRKLPATQAWLHHSVTLAPDLVAPFDDDYAAIRELEEIGQARFGGGISYTRLITPAGLIFEGHSIGRVGSHTANRNSVAVGYCLIGNYQTAHPTEAQLRALAWCLQHDHQHGWLDAPRLDGGHRDLKSTACPGRHAYARISDVNQLAAGPPITDDPSLGGFLMALSDQQQTDLYNAIDNTHRRVMGMLRQRYYATVEDEIVEVAADHPGAVPAAVLDSLDGNYLVARLEALEAKVDEPITLPPVDVEIDYDRFVTDVVDKLADRLGALRFEARSEGSTSA